MFDKLNAQWHWSGEFKVSSSFTLCPSYLRLDYSWEPLFFPSHPSGKYFPVLKCLGLQAQVFWQGSGSLRFQLHACISLNENLRVGHFPDSPKRLEVVVPMMSEKATMESCISFGGSSSTVPARTWCQEESSESDFKSLDCQLWTRRSAFSVAASEVVLARPTCPRLMLLLSARPTPLLGPSTTCWSPFSL